jgi:ferric-dicitrate binding protein FerR (iron transport regulator)
MSEDKNHIDFFDLIPKYLSGEASDLEVKRLEEWVLSSPENKEQFNQFKQAWILSGIEGDYQNIDVEKEWEDTSEKLFPEAKVVALPAKPKHRIGIYLRIAVAVALVIVASVWIFRSINTIDYQEVVAQSEIEENELPDGTEIALNQYSSVKYPEKLDNKSRRVELKGDAFFKVERDETRPFIITTQNIEIEVLGTSFYVDSRENQSQIQVIVETGSVAMSSGSNKIVLTVNEIGIYDKATGQLTKKENEDINYLAWKTDVLVFENTNLERVIFDLNRKFHSQISIANEELSSCPLTATYDDKSLEAIVLIIEKTLDIKAEIDGDKIVFSGQGCD